MFKNKFKLYFKFLTIVFSLKLNGQYNHAISAGVGFPNLSRLSNQLFKNDNGYTSKGSGPFHFKYEYYIKPRITVGLNINYNYFEASYFATASDGNKIVPNKITIKNRSTAFNIRANFFILNPETHTKWQLYTGIGFGYKHGKLNLIAEYPEYKPTITLPRINRFGAECTLGARYFIVKNIGIYTELGLAKSIIQAGVVGRF